MTTFATDTTSRLSLDDALLQRIADRADAYDEAGSFFFDDFAELVDSGYYRAPVPVEFGGTGTSLADLALWHRRIAYRSSATALASGMHLFWVGAAADLHRAGDSSADWILRAAGEGAIFAAGHSESGNDLGLGGSTTSAVPDADGGYRFTGHKHFTSLSPVWTHLGVHGLDTTDGTSIVHGFIERDDPGVRTVENWNTFALRATRSDDTALDGAYSPAERIIAITGPGHPDSAYVTSFAAWALTLTSNVYLGLAQRAFDVAVEAVSGRSSSRLGGAPRAQDPLVQSALADAVVELDAIEAHLDATAAAWTATPTPSLAWGRRIQSAKQHATSGAKEVVDSALQIVGGRGLHHGSTIERLYRDVAAGSLHNPTPHAIRLTLGSPDFTARSSFDR